MAAVVAFGLVGALAADDDKDAPPSAYSPFEHLIGGWKGQGIPAKNRLKGWQEKHNWAWKFDKGKPIGMVVEIVGGKVLTKARLSFDDKTETYTLSGEDPDARPIAFAGKLKDNGVLSMDRLDAPKDVGKERLDLSLNENKIRYVLRLFRQEPDAPQFALVTEANLGKEGESFAAGGAAADLPKCVVTGGAGGMQVSYQGKSYPICCTGCRDEFNDSPEKYVKKYLLRLEKGEAAPLKTTAAGPADSDEPKADPKAMPKSGTAKSKAATKEASKPSAKGDATTKASSLLTQAQALEKSGKTSAALSYYKRIVDEFADTASAKTAAARVKALDKK